MHSYIDPRSSYCHKPDGSEEAGHVGDQGLLPEVLTELPALDHVEDVVHPHHISLALLKRGVT